MSAEDIIAGLRKLVDLPTDHAAALEGRSDVEVELAVIRCVSDNYAGIIEAKRALETTARAHDPASALMAMYLCFAEITLESQNNGTMRIHGARCAVAAHVMAAALNRRTPP